MQPEKMIARNSESPSAPEHAYTPARSGTLAKKSDYRPDIDGLRAIAVLSVIIFHAFPTLAGGGFIGVDIFFVISGYLISKHIWEDLGTGKFSIKAFYARRVRRIFPALSVVLLFCVIAGWVILTPGEYEQLGTHIVASVAFISNLIYWQEAGYFDNAADTKPLLHLWSLGVEEQFYIVWPLFLAFFWRHSRHLVWALLGVLGASLIYSMVLVLHDAVADFYSPLTRFWELALGAGLAYMALHNITISTINRSLISWLGLGLILGALIIINRDHAFPGAWALLPAVGTACLIYAANDAWLNRHVLSHRWLVWFGLISYPLYLWHWPLFSFARIMESETPSSTVRLWLIAASIVLAWLTYKFLERPLRTRAPSRNIVWILCVSLFVLGIAGLAVRKLDGLKSRQLSLLNGDPETLVLGANRGNLHSNCGIAEAHKSSFQYCLSSGAAPRYALLGDSKGEALFYGLARESKPDMQWLFIGSVFPPEGNAASENRQQQKNRLAAQTILHNPSIDVVVLAVALRGIFPLNNDTGFIAPNATLSPEKIADYSLAIQQFEHAGKRVLFIMDNPTFPDPRSCISGGLTASSWLNQFLRRKENPRCTIRYSDHLAGTQAYRQFAGELQRRHPGLIVYDPAPLLCDIPRNECTVTRAGKFLYSYGDHLSDYANSMIARDMLVVIQEAAR